MFKLIFPNKVSGLYTRAILKVMSNFFKNHDNYFSQNKYIILISDFSVAFKYSLHFFTTCFSSFCMSENFLTIDVHFSYPKILTYCFPNILQCLVTLTLKLFLHRTEKMPGCKENVEDFTPKYFDHMHSDSSILRMCIILLQNDLSRAFVT